MKIKTVLILLFLGISASHCTGFSLHRTFHLTPATSPVDSYSTGLPQLGKGGLLYHNHNLPGLVSAGASPARNGEACSKSYLYLLAWGDSSIQTAKQNGKIERIASVEYEQFAILGIGYHKFCTIVTGEGN